MKLTPNKGIIKFKYTKYRKYLPKKNVIFDPDPNKQVNSKFFLSRRIDNKLVDLDLLSFNFSDLKNLQDSKKSKKFKYAILFDSILKIHYIFDLHKETNRQAKIDQSYLIKQRKEYHENEVI